MWTKKKVLWFSWDHMYRTDRQEYKATAIKADKI